jgi:hypothetical protein
MGAPISAAPAAAVRCTLVSCPIGLQNWLQIYTFLSYCTMIDDPLGCRVSLLAAPRPRAELWCEEVLVSKTDVCTRRCTDQSKDVHEMPPVTPLSLAVVALAVVPVVLGSGPRALLRDPRHPHPAFDHHVLLSVF